MSVTDTILELFKKKMIGYDEYSHPETVLEEAEDQTLRDQIELIDTTHVDELRWSSTWQLVYRVIAEDRYIATIVDIGSTENQDYQTIEDAYEVEKSEKVVVDWKVK